MPTPEEYIAEDYTQPAINRGQRKINYGLSMVDEKLIKALEELMVAIANTPGLTRMNLDLTKAAIQEAAHVSEHVADIRPPGCDSTWFPPPPE